MVAIADQMEFLDNTIRNRRDEIEKNTVSIEKFETDCNKLSDEAQVKDNALRELERNRDLARERYDLVSGDLEGWRDEVNRLRDDMIEKMKELNDVGRRQESLQNNLDRLRERITNEWTVDLDNPENVERVEYTQPEADREIRELRSKIKELGPININVMEESKNSSTTLIAPAHRSTAPSQSLTTLPASATWIRLHASRRTSSSCSVSCSSMAKRR